MVKSASRRASAAKVRRAAEPRQKKPAREVEVGPFEPLRIKYWCKKLDIKQDELAARMGMSVEYVSQIANGRRRYDQEILDAAAHAFGISRIALIPIPDDDPIAEFSSMSTDEQSRTLTIAKAALGAARG